MSFRQTIARVLGPECAYEHLASASIAGSLVDHLSETSAPHIRAERRDPSGSVVATCPDGTGEAAVREPSKLRSIPSSSSSVCTAAEQAAGPNFQAAGRAPSRPAPPGDLSAPRVTGPLLCRLPGCSEIARPSSGFSSERCEELYFDLKHNEAGWA